MPHPSKEEPQAQAIAFPHQVFLEQQFCCPRWHSQEGFHVLGFPGSGRPPILRTWKKFPHPLFFLVLNTKVNEFFKHWELLLTYISRTTYILRTAYFWRAKKKKKTMWNFSSWWQVTTRKRKQSNAIEVTGKQGNRRAPSCFCCPNWIVCLLCSKNV